MLVVNKITDLIPNKVINGDVNVSELVSLADPSFNVPDKIDMLLGAESFYELLRPGQIHVGNSQLLLKILCSVMLLVRMLMRLWRIMFIVGTLQQLAQEEKFRFSPAFVAFLHDTYMDDIESGAADLETARQLQSQLRDTLKSCGMTLHKWTFNSPELLNSYLSSDVEHSFSVEPDASVKTLGISGDHLAEIRALHSQKGVLSNSKLKALNHFLDDGVLRVGGHLSNSGLPYSAKYPTVLPNNHGLTHRIIAHFDKQNLHISASSLLQ
ncbi:DUF1758 domain-containing protein [Trichonephila clavipes]|nr:DUF1758 domain-containing protein [Trichonephila clavipes]